MIWVIKRDINLRRQGWQDRFIEHGVSMEMTGAYFDITKAHLPPEEEYDARATLVIINDGTKEDLYRKVDVLVREQLSLVDTTNTGHPLLRQEGQEGDVLLLPNSLSRLGL